mmetsp:Transcript_10935/g.44314  ORF Transcript_10935/g.44314 Transcript_10935/m.44314 type:complete len:103 (-) Transcript_10935:500-808(-)
MRLEARALDDAEREGFRRFGGIACDEHIFSRGSAARRPIRRRNVLDTDLTTRSVRAKVVMTERSPKAPSTWWVVSVVLTPHNYDVKLKRGCGAAEPTVLKAL